MTFEFELGSGSALPSDENTLLRAHFRYLQLMDRKSIQFRRLLTVAAICVSSSGCAVNAYGLVKVERFENDSAVVVGLRSYGLHMLTHRFDAGVVLGRSTRIYVFPKLGAPSDIDGNATDKFDLSRTSSRLTRVSENESTIPKARPIAIFTSATGLMLEGNEERIGFTLGKHTRSSLRLPKELSAILFLKLNTSDIGETRVFFQEKRP